MVKITNNPLILVDGSSYLYRAYYAYPLLKNSIGEPTGAIYGVLNMLKSILKQYKPSHVAVVFDAKGKTFRDQLFKKYKSHRPSMPKDLSDQIIPIYHMVKAMGLTQLSINGVEADDVIGTLALEAARNGRNVLISSSDKDMAQLVSSKITIINTMSNTILGPEEVKLKFGVPPALIIDYLALIGDNADNIPGVIGIGEKSAKVLLREIGGVAALYQQLDKVSTLNLRGAKTIAAKLEKHREVAFLSYQLATIKTDVPLDVSYDHLIVKAPMVQTLTLSFQRYEFQRWLNDLKIGKWLEKGKISGVSPGLFIRHRPIAVEGTMQVFLKDDYQIIDNMIMLNKWITTIRNAGAFAFNTKTDGLDTLTANLLGLCFSVKPGKAAYLPVGHNYLNTPNQLNWNAVLALLKPVFQDSGIAKISQNLKFECGILKRHGIEITGITFDIMLESYVLNSVAGHHDKTSLAHRFLAHSGIDFEKIDSKGYHQMPFDQMTMEQVALYAAEETNVTLRLHQQLWPRIKESPELKKIFEEVEIPLVPVLSRIERSGVLIDESMLVSHSLELVQRLKKLEEEAHQLAQEPFNLSSTKQIQIILYDKQQISVLKKTPGGAPSTNEEVLTALAVNYPLPKLILEYRSLAKLKSTYIDKLPKMINPLSKRVHTSYHQSVTATGRLSSSDPNLQNIPVRNNEGRRIRKAFIAPPGALIVAADYSQIELRIMAHLSQDPGLLHAFIDGQDIHRTTAAEVFRVPLKKVNYDQRRSAKTINFGLIYGMTAFGLARQLSVSRSEAQKYINLYFERYPEVLNYMERTRKQASIQGYVTTLDGRRLYLPDIHHSGNSRKKKVAERAAINAPMQGTAADIIKRAMIALDTWIQEESLPIRIIMQVHDELIFEVHHTALENAIIRIKALMEGCFTLDVPLQVTVGVGNNWDQAH
ncbi:DNA polymerase I [Candidatus Steffania adelgidicola]|uniref:DNA polymerase I n=1 Tax=Candidatus Steffania adelgidicola TaxID=1076626 RepID=UPI001D014124|nr:DNA polymerase I [Candidatus Steffania adelgidicola]UDG79845.1 DNA polymerase I [Candidatus Steffania adelgidicola]